MTKTFVLGAEYDKSELNDIILRNCPLTFRFIHQDNTPVKPDEYKVSARYIYKNGRYDDVVGASMFPGGLFIVPTDLLKPGKLEVVLYKEIDGVITEALTVPPIILTKNVDVFSGHDVLSRILAMFEDFDIIKNKCKGYDSALENISKSVDRLNQINFDPLN